MAAVESFEDWESVHFPEKNPSSSSSAVAPNESETIADVQQNDTVATSSVSPPSVGVICPPPPINHEIVQINQPSSLTLSLPPPENEPGDERGGSEIGVADSGERRRSRDRFEILKSGIYRVVRWCAVGRGSSGLWSCVVVAAAVLMYARLVKWRRWVRDETANRFSLLIREKDEKIKQLMLQIARLNEMLVQRRRVLVVRVPHYYSL